MADEADVYLELKTEEETTGLPADLLSAAKQAAQARGLPAGAQIITLSRSLVEPFLTYSSRRDLREKAWKLWTRRGELNAEKCNYPIANRILELRAQQAKMHGYQSFGDFATADTMAGNPSRVMDLLQVRNQSDV